MSQSDTPFTDSAIDPFLPPMKQEDFNEELGASFATRNDDPTFSAANSNVPEELDYSLDDVSTVPTESTNTTAMSTPEFSGYTFGQRPGHTYSTPELNSPNPYPLRLQQGFQPAYPSTPHRQQTRSQQLPFRHHIVRSQTNTSYHHPQQQFPRTQQPHHRRSLSQGDAERIAAANANANPVFFRLQAPRARSVAPEDEYARLRRRISPYQRGSVGRSASQGPRSGPGSMGHWRGQRSGNVCVQPTSMLPIGMGRGMQYVRGMLPTPIGTPLPTSSDGVPLHRPGIQMPAQGMGMHDMRFARMPMATQTGHSSRVIEVGAMAVLNRPRFDPGQALKDIDKKEGEKGQTEDIMKKLDAVEKHLKYELGDCTEGIKGCEMIREALARVANSDMQHEEDGEHRIEMSHEEPTRDEKPSLVAPSAVFSQEDNEIYNHRGDGDLFNMLQSEPTKENN